MNIIEIYDNSFEYSGVIMSLLITSQYLMPKFRQNESYSIASVYFEKLDIESIGLLKSANMYDGNKYVKLDAVFISMFYVALCIGFIYHVYIAISQYIFNRLLYR